MIKEGRSSGAEVPSVVAASVDRFKDLQIEEVVDVTLKQDDHTRLTVRLGITDEMNLRREHEITAALQEVLMEDLLVLNFMERVTDEEGVTIYYTVDAI